MLQMDFLLFNVEIIRGFTSNFVAIFSANSYPFGFPPKRKHPFLEILKFLVTKFRKQDKKVAFIRVDEYVALAGYSKLINTCHNMNTIVQNTGGDASPLNGKTKIPNDTHDNITISLLLKPSNKKEL